MKWSDVSVGSATENSDEHNFPEHEIYDVSLAFSSIQTPSAVRRETLNERSFRRNVICSTSCLHYLLPDERDSLITDKLRNPNQLRNPTTPSKNC